MTARNRCAAVCAAAMLLCGTGCGSSGSSSAAESSAVSSSEGLQMTVKDGVDADCAACLKKYFEAIDHKDYAAYQETVYAPYREAYAKILKEKNITPEDDFKKLCTRFDEDGYESWSLTELSVWYYENENTSIDNFFKRYVDGGIFDNQFVEDCKSKASEIHDVMFSLKALYAGDSEAVTVVDSAGVLMLKTADGWFLIG